MENKGQHSHPKSSCSAESRSRKQCNIEKLKKSKTGKVLSSTLKQVSINAVIQQHWAV